VGFLWKPYWQILGGYAAISFALLAFTGMFPEALLWVLGPKYSHLGKELFLMVLSAVLFAVLACMWQLNVARGWIVSPWLMIPIGIAAQVIGEPPLFDVLFTDQPAKDYRDTLKADKAIATRFNKLLRERGIMKGESKYYVSLAHTRADIDHTLGAWSEAIAELKKG